MLDAEQRERRFFFIMACVMAITVVAGFGINHLMGRSSFNVPALYHVHAFVFLSWVALYVAQNGLVTGGNIALHRRLGRLAVVLIPAMVVLGIWLTFFTLRFQGGPSFIAQNEFLFVNIFHIAGFASLAAAAIAMRRRTDWHRRLMFGAMATVSAPGLARLLPLPLLIPYVFPALFVASLVFPVVGMIADRKRHGRVHPAWIWASVVPIAALVVGEAVGSTEWAKEYVAAHVAGTPGAERTMEAYLPPM
jgi:hypothetical protein